MSSKQTKVVSARIDTQLYIHLIQEAYEKDTSLNEILMQRIAANNKNDCKDLERQILAAKTKTEAIQAELKKASKIAPKTVLKKVEVIKDNPEILKNLKTAKNELSEIKKKTGITDEKLRKSLLSIQTKNEEINSLMVNIKTLKNQIEADNKEVNSLNKRLESANKHLSENAFLSKAKQF